LTNGLGIALAAITIQVAHVSLGGAALGPADFRAAFVAVAAFSLLSILSFRRLPHDAGSDVTGHRPTARPAGIEEPAE
jgi:hypothetical protein